MLSSLNNNNDLYNEFEFKRNENGVITANNDQDEWFGNFGPFKQIISKLSNRFDLKSLASINENNRVALKYYLIWNGIFALFTLNSFDSNWFTLFESHNSNTFTSCVEDFLFAEIERTRVSKNTANHLINSTNRKDFTKLIEYCIQDIKNPFIYRKEGSGLKYFIINRLTYVVFYNLFIATNSSNQAVSIGGGFDQLIDNTSFPKLNKFFQFLFDFSIYNALYPVRGHKKDESFYILCYFYFKKWCFNTKFLQNCNYFDKYNWDGTLLHKATYHNMEYYVEILLKDGFNCLKRNKMDKTPYNIGKNSNFCAIVTKFQRIRVFNKHQKELEEKEEAEVKNSGGDVVVQSNDPNKAVENKLDTHKTLKLLPEEADTIYKQLKADCNMMDYSLLGIYYVGIDLDNVSNVRKDRDGPSGSGEILAADYDDHEFGVQPNLNNTYQPQLMQQDNNNNNININNKYDIQVS